MFETRLDYEIISMFPYVSPISVSFGQIDGFSRNLGSI